MDLEYKWWYYFDHNKSISDQEKIRGSAPYSLLSGTVLKLTDFYLLSPLMELLLRDEKSFTAMSIFYASMKTHYCCLICELGRYPYKKHPSHEPEMWEQANVISQYEIGIVQACRCVEALIGKPPNKENKGRFLEHEQKWFDQFGINPDDTFQKDLGHSKIITNIFLKNGLILKNKKIIHFDLENSYLVTDFEDIYRPNKYLIPKANVEYISFSNIYCSLGKDVPINNSTIVTIKDFNHEE
jgi:hypothetical protein